MKLISYLGLNNTADLTPSALALKAECLSTMAMPDWSLHSDSLIEEHARQRLTEYQENDTTPRSRYGRRRNDRTRDIGSEPETNEAPRRAKSVERYDSFGQRTVSHLFATTRQWMKTGIGFLWLGIAVFLMSTCWLPEATAKPGLNQPQASNSATEESPDTTEDLERKTWSRGSDIYFANGSTSLTAKDKVKLNRLVKGHTSQIDVTIAVGHSSAHEAAQHSRRFRSIDLQNISVARAKVVRDFLISIGVERNKIYTEGKGITQPQLDERNLRSRRRNRRVEVEVVFVKYEKSVPSAQANH